MTDLNEAAEQDWPKLPPGFRIVTVRVQATVSGAGTLRMGPVTDGPPCGCKRDGSHVCDAHRHPDDIEAELRLRPATHPRVGR